MFGNHALLATSTFQHDPRSPSRWTCFNTTYTYTKGRHARFFPLPVFSTAAKATLIARALTRNVTRSPATYSLLLSRSLTRFIVSVRPVVDPLPPLVDPHTRFQPVPPQPDHLALHGSIALPRPPHTLLTRLFALVSLLPALPRPAIPCPLAIMRVPLLSSLLLAAAALVSALPIGGGAAGLPDIFGRDYTPVRAEPRSLPVVPPPPRPSASPSSGAHYVSQRRPLRGTG